MAYFEAIAPHKEPVGNYLKFSFPWCLLGIQGKKEEKMPIPSFAKERLHRRTSYFVQDARLKPLKPYSQLGIQPQGQTQSHNVRLIILDFI